MTSWKRSRRPFFRICKKKTLSENLRGCFWMRFC
ncbi:hypothetical protein Gotri_028027, partial [Gossypium trilobum]|nr:hypothetical protein [Gossypium trilobum]